jgi:hypothetical protein
LTTKPRSLKEPKMSNKMKYFENRSRTIETDEDAKWWLSELMVDLMEAVDMNFIRSLSDEEKDVLMNTLEKTPFILDLKDMVEESL